jgi:hypothetical protein
MSLPLSEPDLPEPERAALSLLFHAWAVIACAHGMFHRPGVDDDPEGDPGMAARHLSCLAAELDEYGQGVREAAKQLKGKAAPCALSTTAGTSMFEASVNLTERILVAVKQSLVCEMREVKPTGPELKRVLEWADVRDHWTAIRKTLRDFSKFNLDVAQATLSDESRRHLEPASPPAGLRDYVTATEIRTKHTPAGIVLDQRRLVKFLRSHPSIRTDRPRGIDGKPRANRLLVSLADWVTHLEALKEWDSADRDSIETAPKSEIAFRTAAVRSKKQRGK